MTERTSRLALGAVAVVVKVTIVVAATHHGGRGDVKDEDEAIVQDPDGQLSE